MWPVPPAPPKPHTRGQGSGPQPVPLFLPAELTTGKDLGGAEHRDSTNDSLTDEDGKPRHNRAQGPGNREREVDREPALKRGKVSGGPGPRLRRQLPSCRFSVSPDAERALRAADPQLRHGQAGARAALVGVGVGVGAPRTRGKTSSRGNAGQAGPSAAVWEAGPGRASPLVDEREPG